jgi:predicted acyltransferase
MATASTIAPERRGSESPPYRERLVSLDALRGFDMFWILGADGVAQALRRMEDTPVTRFFATQLDHAAWAGFRFYDLIFPLFVFIVGVTTVFSLTKIVARHGRAAAVKRILGRAALLFLFGIFYNGGLAQSWPDVRLVGVLQRIAVCYAITGLLFVFFRPRVLVAVAAALLIGYWALLTFVPIRDIALDRAALAAALGPDTAARSQAHGRPSPEYHAQVEQRFEQTTDTVTGGYEPGRNLAHHLDFQLVPGSMYDTWWDPEGILSTLPSIATCLLGLFAGLLLRNTDVPDQRKALWLAGAGVAALILGYLWGLQFPVVKKIWTSSFVLVAGGWSLLLLAAFFYVIDLRGWRRWCTPFVWIGMNPITLYLITSAVDTYGIARRFLGGSVQGMFDRLVTPGFGELVISLGMLGLLILLARFLYRRGIFLRV